MKKIYTVAIGLLVLGIITCLISFLWGGKTFDGYVKKVNVNFTRKAYTANNEVLTLEVNENICPIQIESGDVDRITVSYCDADELNITITESNGILTITREDCKLNARIKSNIDNATKIIVPKSGKIKYSLSNVSAEITMKNIKADSIFAESCSDRIFLSDLTCDGNMVLGNTSGSIRLFTITCSGNIKTTTVSGGTTLEDVFAAGSVDVKSTSGSTSLVRLQAGSDISLSNTSGSIKGSIIGKASDYKISTSTVSGSNNLKNTNSGSYNLNATNVSGEINIQFVEK